MTDPESPPVESHVVRNVVQGVLILLVVAAVIIAALVVVTHDHAAAPHAAAGGTATPKNMASDGVLLTGNDGTITAVRTPAVAIGHPVPTDNSAHAGTVRIVEYIDYACPVCQSFEATNLSSTATLVASGAATLEIHPVSILDRTSLGTRYSSRGANAAACVANFDPDAFLNVTATLYQYQPAEATKGLTNAQILSLLGKAGVTGPAVTKCVTNETYRDWVTSTTTAVEDGTFQHVSTTPAQFDGTPTVFVNGTEYTGPVNDAAAFGEFVAAQAAG